MTIALGSVVTLPGSRRRVVLERLIGEGSQGAVYEASPSGGGPRLALKWYFPHTGTAVQREAIAELVDRGAPSNRFLWPEELVEAPGAAGFGYVMPLRPERYASLVDLLTGRVDVPFSVVCRLCIELADSFLRLHSQGLCYRDISFSNVFFAPDTGVPLICDNDNVGIDGRGPHSVLGTRRFMAPEIVRREAVPSIATDLYSLAVLLFYVLMMGHPLVGRRELDHPCWDDEVESELFGRSPLFVFDPENRSNEPLPDLHAGMIRNWQLYPQAIRDLFVQAFTAGIRDPVGGRVRESVWRAALARLRDTIVHCGTCGKENFADRAGGPVTCWSCGRSVAPPLWLVIDRRAVALGAGTIVCGHHLRHDYDLEEQVAEVAPHPARPDLLGLRNLTGREWAATLASGEERAVPPGRSIRIEDGLSIDFGVGGHGTVGTGPG